MGAIKGFVESFVDRAEITPAMRQFLQVKDENPDCILLFRMGDFYETFYDDAVMVAKVLDITLTKRGTKNPVPLAGIPYHALENYLPKLIKAGLKVGIVEQLEDPKQAKGVVKRGLVRIVTPGTIIESTMLTEKQNNYLVAFCPDATFKLVGLAVADLSTGEFIVTEILSEQLEHEFTRINPAEILFPETLQSQQYHEKFPLLLKRTFFINPYHDRYFLREFGYKTIVEHFKVLSLDCFALEDKSLAISAGGALLYYLKQTQKASLLHFKKISYYTTDQFMICDKATIFNLELLENIRDKTTHATLLGVLDKTKTPMGGRLLKKWMLHPLLDLEEIRQRHHGVYSLYMNILLRKDIINQLEKINDIERLISRINYGNANPRDLLSLKNSLSALPEIKQLLQAIAGTLFKKIISLDDFKEVTDLIAAGINDDPPISIRDGGIIKQSYNKEVDELHDICSHGKEFIKNLEEKERLTTGIKSLKIGFNNIFGYYIEVTKTNLTMVPNHYIRKQTIANGERFITHELKAYEEKILGAEEKIKIIEYELFQKIVNKIMEFTQQIQETSQAIGELDVLQSFATVAVHNNYVQPNMLDHACFDLYLEQSRHPVIEELEETFIPNDITLNDQTKLMVITGPNMAGKSTVMRQVALIVLMAQIGSFVPAAKAEISVVDRIFTRVGAHDDLTHGQSTFMVEMNETAAILNNATEKSLIIMDEIGRGTSTFDGVALAWSVAEYISKNIKAKTMFATHYHVLTKLGDYPGVKNYNIAVKECEDSIIFLRKLISGGTDKSYGIHVAKLAGLPEAVLVRAREIQETLEEEDTMLDDLTHLTKSDDKNKQMTLSEAVR
ncbi:DNA mismatch repair protein MutS [Candidatus Woesearchaeota archaeon]|nr:DNA mismatch repair protein MutS [Candidatus Woesearchaeota archaeon]